MKIKLLGKNLEELKSVVAEAGLPGFTAKQIAQWLYVKKVRSIEQMTNLSKAARAVLSEKYEVGVTEYSTVQASSDGTRKYLFPVNCTHKKGLNRGCSGIVPEDELESSSIEAVMIPDADRATLCVSSQAGCKMGCKFCATGRMGFRHHLSATEIINQVLSIPERDKLTNIVFMGMGEPLDNIENVLEALEIITSAWGMAWSPTRVTLSTAGVAKNLRRFLDETKVHLAVSLHNPFHEERKEIMPIENAYPIREIADILREYDFTGQRRVSFEYIVMEGLNDSPAHIKELCRLLDGIKCRMNLIRFHKIPDSPYFSPSDEKMIRFRDTLTAKGIQTTIRASRGEDIKAACGLLSTAEQAKKEQ